MKISSTILSIPPYISTSWQHIASLHLEEQSGDDVLIFTLHNGARIEVPNLSSNLIETIFTAHIHHLELEERKITINKPLSKMPMSGMTAGNPGHFSLELLALSTPPEASAINAEGFNPLIHDPSQANMPELPADVLDKISQIAQTMGIDDPSAFPQPERDCNCMRCQIAQAIQNSFKSKNELPSEEFEEIVSDEELKFNTWNVLQKEKNLYIVTNPLERHEQYHVHLAAPIGCTCGHDHCEHIRAVLNS